MKLWILMAVAALAGCASVDGEGQAMRDGIGALTDAAKVGPDRWVIHCEGPLSNCTWRAAQVCPTGFDVEESKSTLASGSLIASCRS